MSLGGREERQKRRGTANLQVKDDAPLSKIAWTFNSFFHQKNQKKKKKRKRERIESNKKIISEKERNHPRKYIQCHFFFFFVKFDESNSKETFEN